MNEKNEWQVKIIALTNLIREKYPELYQYLAEMPVTNPDENHPNVDEELKGYYESLHSMMVKYAHEHPASFDTP